MSTKLYFLFRPKWGAYAATIATAAKTSLQKCVSPRCFNYTLSRLFHLVRIHFVNSELLTNSSVGGWILKDCIKLQEKKKKQKVVVLCSLCPHQNVKLGITSSVVRRRLRNVSKSVMCTCRAVLLLTKISQLFFDVVVHRRRPRFLSLMGF